jgi:hypothetical protein
MTHDTFDPTTERAMTERVAVEPVVPAAPTGVAPPAAVSVVERRVVRDGPSGADRIRRIAVLLFGVLQGLLILRIVLLLLAANAGNDVVSLVTGATDPFVDPFRGMFSLDRVDGAGGSTLDLAAVVALMGWTLVEALVLGVASLADRRPAIVA